MQIEQPYFMTNPAWYTFNEVEWRYELTDAAPERARASYAEYYNTLDSVKTE